MRILTILLIVFVQIQCLSQNNISSEGLNIGMWLNEYELAYGKFKETGRYKIVDLTQYDTIKELGSQHFEIKYKGSNAILFVENRFGNKVSVKDSIWITVDSLGRIYKINNWFQGINLWTKHFDNKGNLVEFHYDDFENNTSFYLTYNENQLFKKAFYPPNNKNQQTEIYYPDRNLIIPNAEFSYSGIFGSNDNNNFRLNLTCKESTQILSIKNNSKNVIIESSDKLPMKLLPNNKVEITLRFTPTSSTYRQYDTIIIETSEKNALPYKMYCSMNVAHINSKNVETLKDLKLSKLKDKYLYIQSMGTVTDAYIKSTKQEEKHYQIWGVTKIDLNTLELGQHSLSISSCNNGGYIKLNIVE